MKKEKGKKHSKQMSPTQSDQHIMSDVSEGQVCVCVCTICLLTSMCFFATVQSLCNCHMAACICTQQAYFEDAADVGWCVCMCVRVCARACHFAN